MKAKELIAELFHWADPNPAHYAETCDTLKAGDPEVELHHVAVAMFGTPEVLRQAHQWGAELLIVHEPLFYNHMDERLNRDQDPVALAKEQLLRDTQLTIYRFHDHPHHQTPDLICAGELKFLGLEGPLTHHHYAANRLVLKTPVTPLAVAEQMRNKLHIKHVRISGAAAMPMSRLSLFFGTPAGLLEELQCPESELVLAGEACEWQVAEYARDAAQLGFRKALIVMGHAASERDGMRLLTEHLQQTYPRLAARYFECGEVYC